MPVVAKRMNASVVCEEITKVYDSRKGQVKALDHVSFTVKEGEIFGLLGPNGAGKTTLVKILATLLKATGGRATVGGYDVDKEEDKVRRIIGYAGQDSERSAYFRLTAWENLYYFAHALRDVPRDVVKRRIKEIAEAVGFTDRLDKYFIALSGGEKQLVIVMRALLHDPEICFLDEPSKSLDPITARRVRFFLRDYAHENMTTICLTTHNMLEAEEVCDRLALINHGKIIFIGTPTEFKRRAAVKETIEIALNNIPKPIELSLLDLPGVNKITHGRSIRLNCEDAFNILPDVVNVLKHAGLRASVRIVEPSLEDAFVSFVKNYKGEEDGYA